MSLNLFKLGLTSFFTDISSEMIYPFLGIYFATLGATPAVIGIIEGVAEGLAYILRVFSGFISDYFQRRKYLTIIGYFLSTLGKIFLYVFNIILLISLGRWLDRVGKGIRNAPRDALISESVSLEERGKAFGFHRFMDTLGATLGVFISFLILVFLFNENNHKDLLKTLILFSIFPAIIGILILFFVKDTTKKEDKKQSIHQFFSNGILEVKNNKNLMFFLIINFIFALSNSSDQFIFLKASELKIELKEIVLSYLFYNISYAIFSYPSGKLSDKISRKYLIGIGYLIYSITYFLIPYINSFYTLLMIFFFYGMHKAMSEGVEKAFITDYTKEYKASILGLQSTLYGIAMIFASSIGGFIWYHFGSSTMFYFDALLSLIAAIGIFVIIK